MCNENIGDEFHYLSKFICKSPELVRNNREYYTKYPNKAKKKIYMCLLSHVKKSGLIFFLLLSTKPEIVVPGSGIRYFIFEISCKPSFIEAAL